MEARAMSPDTMMRCFDAWGWTHGLARRGAETLFVTDTDIAAILKGALPSSTCRIVEVDALDGIATTGVSEAIFFCRDREKVRARRFAARHPDTTVSSGTYDYLPSGILFGRFERSAHADTPVKLINAIIAAPASGATDLVSLMEANKVCKIHGILDHTVLFWAQTQSDFELLRYLKGVGNCYSDDKVDVLVETDVLCAIAAHTGLAWRRLFPKEPAIPVNILYFMRRAKIAQALELAETRGVPTVTFDMWETRDIARVDASGVDAWIEVLLRLEIEIESAMAPIKKMKNITAEDLHGAPDNVLPDAAAYFKRGLRKRRDYGVIYQALDAAARREPHVQEHSRRLIDRLGLVVSDEGSFTSITNTQLLET